MAGRKAFDQILLSLFDSDWLPSSLYDNAGSSTMCFSFVDVNQYCVIPVTTGAIRILGGRTSKFQLQQLFGTENWSRWRCRRLCTL